MLAFRFKEHKLLTFRNAVNDEKIQQSTEKDMLNRFLCGAAALVISAQISAVELDTGFYIAPSISYQNFGGNLLDDGFTLDSAAGFSVGAGYQFDPRWAAELAYTKITTDVANANVEADAEYLHLDGFYHLEDGNDNNWSSYWVAGIGQQSYEDEDDFQINGGVGLKYTFDSHFYFRTDLRASLGADDIDAGALFNVGLVYIFKNSDSTQNKTEATTRVAQTETMSVTTPADNDTDKDGVANDKDKCLDTKAGAKVDANGCNEALKETKEFTLNVQFKTGSSVIEESSKANIQGLAEFLNAYPDTQVSIEGHSDSSGNAASNKTLSQKRADAVKQTLQTQYGIDANRIQALGFGAEQPIADNATPEGRTANRRVVAKVKN